MANIFSPRNRFMELKRTFGFVEPEYAKNYQRPEILISWVRWHGPYNSFDDWLEGAKSYNENEKVRLYMALGKKRWFSIFSKPRVQYVGLNSRDARQELYTEINAKKNDGKTFGALFNEFWVGELIADWEKVARSQSSEDVCDAESVEIDTPNYGLTKNTEKSLIYALAPEQDEKDKKSPPKFSFRIINQACSNPAHTKRIIKRFHRLVPDYIEFDRERCALSKYRLTFENWR